MGLMPAFVEEYSAKPAPPSGTVPAVAEGGPKAEGELTGLIPDGLVEFGIEALPVVVP